MCCLGAGYQVGSGPAVPNAVHAAGASTQRTASGRLDVGQCCLGVNLQLLQPRFVSLATSSPPRHHHPVLPPPPPPPVPGLQAPSAADALSSFDYPPVGAVTLAYPDSAIRDDRRAPDGSVPGFGQLHPRSQVRGVVWWHLMHLPAWPTVPCSGRYRALLTHSLVSLSPTSEPSAALLSCL